MVLEKNNFFKMRLARKKTKKKTPFFSEKEFFRKKKNLILYIFADNPKLHEKIY